MAKTKQSTDPFSEIAKLTSGDVLEDLDSVKYFVDTGNLAFNYVCSGKFINGGIPGEKVTEIFGPSSSGKSLIANNVLFGCQKLGGWAIILDCENSTNKEFMARASHLDPKKIIRHTPFTLEQAFMKIHTVCKAIREYEKKNKQYPKPIVFVYDSITVSPCERELREANLPENYKPSDWKKTVGAKEQPGERARVCSRELRKINAKMEEYGATLMIINQTRQKIGVMFGSPETTGGGGTALEFYASCRLRTSQKKKIENKRLETHAGVNMHVKNVKNKTFDPFVTAEDIKVYFQAGVDPHSGLLKTLMKADRVKMVSNGNFQVLSDYLPEGQTEYKFKASKTNNTMPLEVILDCPKLVDAESREQVEEYLRPFHGAMDSTNSDDFEEKDVKFDFDGSLLDDEVEDSLPDESSDDDSSSDDDE